MSTAPNELFLAAQAIKDQIRALNFSALPALSLHYRRVVQQGALDETFWSVSSDAVSMKSLMELLTSTVRDMNLSGEDFTHIIQSFPISPVAAMVLINKETCPIDLITKRMIESTPVSKFDHTAEWLVARIYEKSLASGDLYVAHLLKSRPAGSGLSKSNLDYMFAALEAIQTPSPALRRELRSADQEILERLKMEVDDPDKISLGALTALHRGGCKGVVRFAFLKNRINWHHDPKSSATAPRRAAEWQGIMDAKVPLPLPFIKEALNGCGYGQTPHNEAPAFVYFLHLVGRDVDVKHTPSPASLNHQISSLMSSLAKAVTVCDVLEVDYESRLVDVLQFLSDGIESDARFSTAVLESGLSGKFFEKFPRMKPHMGQLFSQDIGL
jgi:hypothetical protein